MFLWIESCEIIQFYSTINWTLHYFATGLKKGGSINLATKKVIACLSLTSPLLLYVMEAVRNIENFPSVSGNCGHFLQNVKKYVVVKMGNGHLWRLRKIEKPEHLSSVLSCASNMFSDLEQISLPHWTCLSLPLKRNCQTKCSRRSYPAWCWIQCISSLDLFTQSQQN